MRRITFLAILLILGSAPICRAQEPAAAPDTVSAQKVVPRLSNFTTLATIMNLARGTVRILVVVAPSSPDAEKGLDAVAAILHENPSKRLRAYVVLSRTGDEDTEVRAVNLAGGHLDRRIVYLWDPGDTVAAAIAASEELEGIAPHDLILLYDTTATFTTAAPSPVMWVPLAGDAPVESGALKGEAEQLVHAVEKAAAAGGQGQ